MYRNKIRYGDSPKFDGLNYNLNKAPNKFNTAMNYTYIELHRRMSPFDHKKFK